GFNLNMMTLGWLALAVGLIVDDAIFVLENIFRRVERGETQVVAAKSGAAQIYGAVMSSTTTVMIVFLPMLLVGGVASKIFQPFALVVVFAIGVSLLVSLSVVPMLAARFIRASDVEESHVDRSANLLAQIEAWCFERFGNGYRRLESSYRKALSWSLGHGVAVALIAGAAVVVGIFMLVSRGVEFLPPSNTNYVTVNYKLPTGTALALNDRFARKVERDLRSDRENVQDVYGNIGASQNFVGFGTRPVSNSGQIFVTLKPTGPGSTRTLSTDAYVEKLRQSFAKMPGVRAYPTAVDIVSRILSFATGASLGVEVNLYGPDLAKLSALGNAAVESLRNRVPGLINVRTSISDSAPQMDVAVDRDRAAQLGVPLSAVADSVATATNGTVASRYEEGGQQYDITVIYPENERKSANNINQLTITTPTGQVVPLSEVATVSFGKGPNQITREDKQRFIGIQGDVLGAPAGTVSKEVQQRLQSFPLPLGYRFDFAAGQETQNQTFASLGLALVLAVVLIYMLLAAKYESLWQPLVIMLTLPLAIVGVGLGLLIFRQSLGLTAFIGLLTLVGIVVKNAILLVEFTNQLRGQGLTTKEALMQAGPVRMRPILMTTSATSLGLLPLGLALQPGSETQAPLAAVVIGGLVTSTFLTLIVIPVAYYSTQRLVDRYMRTRFGRYASDAFGITVSTNGSALNRSVDIDVREEERV
ncbi:MAG: efflux RND transporter permease subunit, partial [Candidatus Eremiobacteraeota bacterium]|nr:efflux RND transporter permease subunit [Candidatus Eremiobacteraeota bacterium]